MKSNRSTPTRTCLADAPAEFSRAMRSGQGELAVAGLSRPAFRYRLPIQARLPRSIEDVVFQRDIVVNRNIVLDFAVVANHHPIALENILSQRSVFFDRRSFEDIREMPNLGFLSNGCHFHQ